MSQCPFIDRRIPASEINIPVTFKCGDGSEYVFFDHTAPWGDVTRVQFCQRIGRKRDVFECLNESEWRACYAYDPDLKATP